MDPSRVAAGNGVVNGSKYQVVDLLSDQESDIADGLVSGYPRVNINELEDLDASEDGLTSSIEDEENEEWEVESLFEDTLEEMGDEHLFEGGRYRETPVSRRAKNKPQTRTRALSKKQAHFDNNYAQ